jgi:hypothetical protein
MSKNTSISLGNYFDQISFLTENELTNRLKLPEFYMNKWI